MAKKEKEVLETEETKEEVAVEEKEQPAKKLFSSTKEKGTRLS